MKTWVVATEPNAINTIQAATFEIIDGYLNFYGPPANQSFRRTTLAVYAPNIWQWVKELTNEHPDKPTSPNTP